MQACTWYNTAQYLNRVESDENNCGFIPQEFTALKVKGLRVAPSIQGDFSDVKISNEIAFSAMEDGKRIDGYGLEYFVEGVFQIGNQPVRNQPIGPQLTSFEAVNVLGKGNDLGNQNSLGNQNILDVVHVPGVIFDNHNHALYFWCKFLLEGGVSLGSFPKIPLVHIDMHSDLWKNANSLAIPEGDLKQETLNYIAEFTNTSCTVANYIDPAIRAGIIGEVIRIEGEQDLLEKGNRVFDKPFFLNIDLDFFAEELDDIDFILKKSVIHHYLRQKPFVTVATSPFFIPSDKALDMLKKVFLEG